MTVSYPKDHYCASGAQQHRKWCQMLFYSSIAVLQNVTQEGQEGGWAVAKCDQCLDDHWIGKMFSSDYREPSKYFLYPS
jgi:hypothetical protein